MKLNKMSNLSVLQLKELNKLSSPKKYEPSQERASYYDNDANLISLSILSMAHEKDKSSSKEILLLKNKKKLELLQFKINLCIEQCVTLLVNKILLDEQEIAVVEMFYDQLHNIYEYFLTLSTIFIYSPEQFHSPQAPLQFLQTGLQELNFLNNHLKPQEAVRRFIEKVTAFLILLDNKHNLQLLFVPHLPLAKKSKADLLAIVGEHAHFFVAKITSPISQETSKSSVYFPLRGMLALSI